MLMPPSPNTRLICDSTPGTLRWMCSSRWLRRMRRQRHLGEVHRRQRRAVVAVADQLVGDFGPDVLLCLRRAAADVRRQHHVVAAEQRRHERSSLDSVPPGYTSIAAPSRRVRTQRRRQRVDIDDVAARCVDQARRSASSIAIARAPIMLLRRRRLRHVQRHDVAGRSSSSSESICRALPRFSLLHDVVESTCIPSASASTPSCVPMLP